MHRRELSAAIFASAAGATLLPRGAESQTCTPPCFATTPAETAAGVTPINRQYPPGHVDRYGTNTTPGTTNMRSAFQAAINQARVGGADVVWGDTGFYVLGAGGALDCTFAGSGAQYGLNFRQISTPSFNLPPNTRGGILVTHNDYTVFDLTGCQNFSFYDLSLVTNSSGYPKTCFLTARNSTGGSLIPRFHNTAVVGFFSTALLYNYASEDGVYVGNYWSNNAGDSGAKVIALTSKNNILPGNGPSGVGMASAYTTIFSGSNSCIDHQFFGGQYLMPNASAASDIFYLDGIENLKVFGPWMYCPSGRAYFYSDGTNSHASFVRLHAVQGERGSQSVSNGVLFSANAGTPTGWSLIDCYWQVSAFSIATGGASVVVDNLRVWNLQEVATKGINVPGKLQNSVIEYFGIINVGTAPFASQCNSNVFIGNQAEMNLIGRVNTTIMDKTAGALLLTGGIGIWENPPANQQVGWGTPSTTGGPVTNFPGSSATVAQCGQAIGNIIAQLKAIGLLGA